MNTKVLGAVAIGSLLLIAGNASAAKLHYALHNSPDGAVDPQLYGMRLDGFGGDNPATFSFEDSLGNSTVSAVLDTVAQTFTISGTVSANSANGGTDFGTFTLSVTFNGNYNAGGVLFTSTQTAGIGTVTGLATTGASPIGDGQSFALSGMQNGAGLSHIFDDDGFRVPGSNDALSGRGWLSSPESSGTEDFLYTATMIPLPHPGVLAGVGCLGVIAIRRRR